MMGAFRAQLFPRIAALRALSPPAADVPLSDVFTAFLAANPRLTPEQVQAATLLMHQSFQVGVGGVQQPHLAARTMLLACIGRAPAATAKPSICCALQLLLQTRLPVASCAFRPFADAVECERDGVVHTAVRTVAM